MPIHKLPALSFEQIDDFIRTKGLSNCVSEQRKRRTRSSLHDVLKTATIKNLTIDYVDKSSTATAKADLTDASNSTIHQLVAEFNTKCSTIESITCKDCSKLKVQCGQLHVFLLWLQRTKSESMKEENENSPIAKRIKQDQTSGLTNKEVNYKTEAVSIQIDITPMPKIKIEPFSATPLELERASKLSMINLVREFSASNDPNEFLQFCTRRMQEENYKRAEILTVEQADTDLWHELRKGRITASRIYEASRCKMKNGSLADKIMGIRSGFSFAMKRGTDLEGYVFAELKKEFPSLRNTGLVLDPEFPWMGASPDGLSDEFVLEIKCPYTPKTYECYIDVNKLSKKYFAQIQLQMHMTHRKKALLGVAALNFERTRNVTKVWIDYDEQYVRQLMKEAFEFWIQSTFPALMKRRPRKVLKNIVS